MGDNVIDSLIKEDDFEELKEGSEDGQEGQEGKEGQDGQEGQEGQEDGQGDTDSSKEGEDELSEEDISKAREDYLDAFELINNGDDELKKSFLDKYKGTSFDDEGNILNDDGEVVAKQEDIVKDIASEDEEENTYNDNGDLIDAEGNVLETAYDIATKNIEANKISNTLGYKFQDEKGNPKIYKEGEEGVKELAKDISNASVNDFVNSNPVIKDFANHVLSGNKPEDFQKSVDYESVDVSKLDKQSKRNFIKDSLENDGVNPDRAKKLSELVKDSDLDKETQEALNLLDTSQKEQAKLKETEIENKRIEREKETEEYWDGVKNTVDNGNLDGINIPQKEREEFFNYLAVPHKDNKSKNMIDSESMKTEDILKEAYFRFKGYKVEDLIKEEAQKVKLSSLRNRINKAREKNQSGGASRKNTKISDGDISIDNIIK